MSEFQYKAGLHHVGSYQISGIPYVTGSLTAPTSSGTPIVVEFPSVTKFVSVTNSAAIGGPALRVGYSENGVKGTNFSLVNPQATVTYEVRTDKVYLLSNGVAITNLVSVAAGVTGIQIDQSLTAIYSGSVGIG